MVSEVGLGGLTLGREVDENAVERILGGYLDFGGNFVDTADVYGGGASETVLGRVLGSRRDGIVLATKCGFPTSDRLVDSGPSRRHILDAIHTSLRRLRTDWIDLYQIHTWDTQAPLEEILSTLNDLVHQGTVRYIGASNYAAWHMAKALGLSALRGWEPFVSIQPSYSLIAREAEVELIPLCRSEGLALLPYSPLGGGVLTGKYKYGEPPGSGTRAGGETPSVLFIPHLMTARNIAIADVVGDVAADIGYSRAQVALNWVLHKPGVTAPILGIRTVEQLEDNLGALGWRLDEEHVRLLDNVSEPYFWHPHDIHVKLGVRPKDDGAAPQIDKAILGIDGPPTKDG